MKKVNIYEDGKLSRGVKAELLSKNKDQVVISFYDDYEEKYREETFKKYRKGVYYLNDGNFFFYPEMETAVYTESVKGDLTEDYWNFLFGDNL